MDQELKAAAERWKQHTLSNASDAPVESPYCENGSIPSDMELDLRLLADAYLAALESHRRDAEEGARPLTREILLERGWSSYVASQCPDYLQHPKSRRVRAAFSGERCWLYFFDGCVNVNGETATSNMLNHLEAALGVAAKEGG